MNQQHLIDTDVIIDYLRGHELATEYLEQTLADLYLSTITVAELYAGVKEGKERSNLEKLLLEFEILPIDKEIASLGGLFKRDHKKSHNTSITDAMIAATAKKHKALVMVEHVLGIRTFRVDPEFQHAARTVKRTGHAAFAFQLANIANVDQQHIIAPHERDCFTNLKRFDFSFRLGT